MSLTYKKIKASAFKFRSIIFIIVAIVIFVYFRNYVADKNFDPNKFKSISKYTDQSIKDLEDNIAFSNGEIDSIDLENRRDTDLLDTEEIKPETNFEQALIIIMAEAQKFNIALKENEESLMEAQKDIYPDTFMLPINLSSLDAINKSKKELQVLKSSSKEFRTKVLNHFKKYEQAILKRIDNTEYADQIIKNAKKSVNVTINYHDILNEQYEGLGEIFDFCTKAISEETIQYLATEDNIFFTTDELVDKYNRLIETFNKTVIFIN